MTLYLKMGGRSTFTLAIERLMDLLQSDPAFNSAAAQFSSEHQDDLSEFLIFVTGGAPTYEKTSIGDLLCNLCPSDEAFDAFVDHLVTAPAGNTQPVQNEVELRLLMEHIRFYAVNGGTLAGRSDQTSAKGMAAM